MGSNVVTLTFDATIARFRSLLDQQEWPEAVSWTIPEHVIVFPMITTYVYRPGKVNDLGVARKEFEAIRDKGKVIEVHGVGHVNGVTYGFVGPIEVLAQGEDMFLEENVKICISGTPTEMVVTRSRFRWWTIAARNRRWRRRIDAAFRAG